jgi:outer membrane protein assembly factor BamE (lipoprotein component of BamABCDE complex)
MTMKRSLAALCLLLLIAAASFTGCAFGNFGKADMTYSKVNVPEGLVGKDKEQILKKMGIPDSVTSVGGTEYWDYNNKCGYFILLFGKTIEKDLILDFKDGKVASSYLVDKGASMGLLSSQGAVAR